MHKFGGRLASAFSVLPLSAFLPGLMWLAWLPEGIATVYPASGMVN